jgi:hypothetical protein
MRKALLAAPSAAMLTGGSGGFLGATGLGKFATLYGEGSIYACLSGSQTSSAGWIWGEWM